LNAKEILHMPSRLKVYFAAAILGLAALVGGSALLWKGSPLPSIGEALVGGPFAMTDQNGKRVSEKDFLGRYMLVFFGFTYCPDVCPTELQVMTAALAELGEAGKAIQPVFVSIDPDRDTAENVKAYVANFGGTLIGLTGSAEDVAVMAKAYRVFYQKVPGPTGQDYTIDHSSIIYLMGPDGKFRKHFTYTTDPRALAEGLRRVMAD
jgi:cytochrome oxidase Cu insertion factor (SCO1/SenC/PrrC family)